MFHVRAPDHLGDGVMALPAIRALAALGPCRVYAPRWGPDLYVGIDVLPVDARPEGGVGVLLKPSFGAAWRWRHLPRRVGLAGSARRPLLTDPLPETPAEHRREGYARVVAVLGARVEGPPVYAGRGVPVDLPPGYVALNPWSPTPTVRWPHFRALAGQLGAPVVFFAGPGEEAPVRALAGPHRVVAGLSLPDFAATLQGCRVFVSGDSGAAHFAAACGVRVVVLHGPTAASLTGVGEGIDGADLTCRPCYAKHCPYGVPCLSALPVERVLGRIA